MESSIILNKSNTVLIPYSHFDIDHFQKYKWLDISLKVWLTESLNHLTIQPFLNCKRHIHNYVLTIVIRIIIFVSTMIANYYIIGTIVAHAVFCTSLVILRQRQTLSIEQYLFTSTVHDIVYQFPYFIWSYCLLKHHSEVTKLLLLVTHFQQAPIGWALIHDWLSKVLPASIASGWKQINDDSLSVLVANMYLTLWCDCNEVFFTHRAWGHIK